MTKQSNAAPDQEITAISKVYEALKGLAPEAQMRVLSYVAAKLNIEAPTPESAPERRARLPEDDDERNERGAETKQEAKQDSDDELEGISPVARKWITRSGLQPASLSKVFSLSTDEIDLIAKTVPGKSQRDRMRSVFLLKGIAAYLGSGAARFSHAQIKEACLHYDAFDSTNFSKYLKSLSGEVSGSKDTEYALTPRGIAGATEMVKEMTQPGKTN
jgi:hypothetical protein